MSQLLVFFVQYEALLYFLLGLAGILYLYRFWNAWQDVRLSVFGLEREASRARLNQTAIVLFFLLLSAVLVFVMVSFVATSLPAQALLATPTLDLSIQTPAALLTATVPAGAEGLSLFTATPLPTVSIRPADCLPDEVFISAPESGESLQGAVEIRGTVSVADFGFYKLEWARLDAELWTTIQAGRVEVQDDVLVESWDTSRVPPGSYALQLVVVDNQGLELPPCRVTIQIEEAESNE